MRDRAPLQAASLHAALACLLLTAFGAAVRPAPAAPPRLPRIVPDEAGMDSRRLDRIDEAVARALDAKQLPGCVVLVGRAGGIVFRRAYGNRRVEPEPVPMATDTVFDLASLTKPVATATSVMCLIERGRLRLSDRVAEHIPEFAPHGKDKITVLQLLTHQAGLIPDNPLRDYDDGPDLALERINALSLRAEPGEQFIYTDVGYIVLAELVRRLTGRDVHEFSQENVFGPLGMRETGFVPSEALRERAAPTERRDGRWMQGEVHDPRAYRMHGIAGHAGLFSTADDLAVYSQLLLNGGAYGGATVLGRETVALMTRPVPVSSGERALGWDVRTGYSSNRGELFSPRAFGHGGFTGTALWIDPELDLFVIFLSNRLHPDGKGFVNPLAGRIGTIAAGAIVREAGPPPAGDGRSLAASADPARAARHGGRADARHHARSPEVLTGIDVLKRDGFGALQGQRVGLITNHTGVSREGASTVLLLHEAPDVELAALFSPEHGFEGQLDVPRIADSRDEASGLPIHSLYGTTRRPTAESLEPLDVLVFDIQDVGTRFYTYVSTMGRAMQAAAEHGVRFVVLDRPNPINGVDVDGPLLDAGKESFVGFHTIPVRHGMTAGELARMFNAELGLKLDLHVVEMEGWRRRDFYDATGLAWINPSPNMRNLTQALLYPGIGLLETTNLSVGRGTDTPFEVIGAPWLDGAALARALNAAGLDGVRFVPTAFTPDSSKFAGERCGGVNILIVDRARFEPLRTGFEVAVQLRRLHPDQWEARSWGRLLASDQVLQALLDDRSADELAALARPQAEGFLQRRKPFLLYE